MECAVSFEDLLFGDWFAVCPNPPLGVPPSGVVRLLVPFFYIYIFTFYSVQHFVRDDFSKMVDFAG